MSIITGITMEDVIFMLIAYFAGVLVTSLITNRDRYTQREDVHAYGAYEHVIADLMARVDVIDLKMKRLYDITGSLRDRSHKGADDKYVGDLEHDTTNSSSRSNGYDGTTSIASDHDGSKKESSLMDIGKGYNEEGMDGRLMIISSNRDDNKVVAEERRERGSSHVDEGNGSTIERVLSIIQEGPKTSREMEQRLGMSREHTARLMKRLYDMGYLTRDESKRPYRYTLAKGTP